MECELSIITVVLNDPEGLQKTIKSVSIQQYRNYEYVVIDGGSHAETIKVIKDNSKAIDHWVSEKDKGIYDAMNKGLSYVHGKWVIFLNAGDVFVNSLITRDLFKVQNMDEYDVWYGDHRVEFMDIRGERKRKAGKMKYLKYGSQFCHQSAIVKTELIKEKGYNTLNRISADFEFFYGLYMNDKKFGYAGFEIAKITSGGLSDVSQVHVLRSWEKVVLNSDTESSLLLKVSYEYRILMTSIRQIVKKFLYTIPFFKK